MATSPKPWLRFQREATDVLKQAAAASGDVKAKLFEHAHQLIREAVHVEKMGA